MLFGDRLLGRSLITQGQVAPGLTLLDEPIVAVTTVKAVYDPHNLFRVNRNIPPSG